MYDLTRLKYRQQPLTQQDILNQHNVKQFIIPSQDQTFCSVWQLTIQNKYK